MEPTAHSTRVRIENLDELRSHGLKDLRDDALAIAQVGLTACDGARATANAVALTDGGISVAGVEYELAPGAKLVVLGAGKATLPIAEALEDVLGDRIDSGAVILRRGEVASLSHIEVFIADHPLPTLSLIHI